MGRSRWTSFLTTTLFVTEQESCNVICLAAWNADGPVPSLDSKDKCVQVSASRMWFNSFGFWIFFGVVALALAMTTHRGRNRVLLMASYFFYGCWDRRFLALIFACTWVNYVAALKMEGAGGRPARRGWVLVSLVFSLGVLGVFKYFNFFAGELGVLFAWIGVSQSPWVFSIALPAGISFFTFQALSYTIDVYRGHTRVSRDFWDFALFISFFPQLVAGPIERSSHLLPQVTNPRPKLDEVRFRRGLYWVLTGLYLKVCVADNMAWLANYIFDAETSQLGALDVLFGVYAFAFQIYGDFAGYSAIACGTACWLGFDLMINFRRPYLSASPKEFWQRWHISLSSWLRDYLYIPLGGNREGAVRTARNLMVTMLLGGLWHGAAWTFLAWGAVHGIWLSIHRWLSGRGDGVGLPKTGGKWKYFWLRLGKGWLTFHVICLTWLLFRAESFSDVTAMLHCFGGDWSVSPFVATSFGLMCFFALPWMAYEVWVEWVGDDEAMLKAAWWIRAGFYAFLVLMLLFFPPPAASEFIYFQF